MQVAVLILAALYGCAEEPSGKDSDSTPPGGISSEDECTGTVEQRIELIRETGAPQEVTFSLDTSTARCVTVEAGWAADGPGQEAVPAPSSAWIEIDDEKVFGPDLFNGTTWSSSWSIPASGEEHEVHARIASKPGSGLRLWIHTAEPEDPEVEEGDPDAWIPSVVAHVEHEGASLTLVHPNGSNLYEAGDAGVTIDINEDYVDDNPYGTDVLGFAYDIGPDGQVNDPPLIATVTWPEGTVTDEEAKHLRVLLQDKATGIWEAAPVLQRSISGRYVRVAVRHHSFLTLILPDVLEPIATYVADKAVEYASTAFELAYGDDAGENHFSDFASGTTGANSVNFVMQSVSCGFLGCSDSDTAFAIRDIYDTAMGTTYRLFYRSDLDYGESWRNPADFQGALEASYEGTSGFDFDLIECDTLTDYFDYTNAQAGDVITGDFPPGFVPDPSYVPDGVIDFAFLVTSINSLYVGYNEVRLTYQDTEGHTDVGLGTINEEFYKRAIFCLWRPTDLNPTDKTGKGESDEYPDPQSCETCDSVETCQSLTNSIISLFPDYANTNTTITFESAGPEGYCDGFTSGVIRCPPSWVSGGIITNKLLFHELNHKLKTKTLASGSSGICSDGACSSSELQASLLEELYYPEDCSGGHYQFTGADGVVRTSVDIVGSLQEDPAVPESDMWDYAMGRSDDLVHYMDRFGTTQTSDLYNSQTYDW